MFKRLRQFTWIEPIHETIQLQPVVYDSDIVITHMPQENHGGRDLANFERQVRKVADYPNTYIICMPESC